MGGLRGLAFSLIPGPAHLDGPISSVDLHDIARYSPGEVTAGFLAVPGTELVRADPGWWRWEALWSRDEESIGIGMTLFDTDPPLWGGSHLQVDCAPETLLWYWLEAKKRLPAAWLHDGDCVIYTPGYFQETFVRPARE